MVKVYAGVLGYVFMGAWLLPVFVLTTMGLVYLFKSAFLWLKDGVWQEHTGWDVMEFLHLTAIPNIFSDWLGIYETIDWFLNLQPTISGLIILVVCFPIWVYIILRIDEMD